LRQARNNHSAYESAWLLRRALDKVFIDLPKTGDRDMKQITNDFLIDDFSRQNNISTIGTQWRDFTDRVMGGVSSSTSEYQVIDGRRALRLQGEVSLENNGGFIQIALPLRTDQVFFDAGDYEGIRLWVRGNGQPYYVHLRSNQTLLPWQYYSAEFDSTGIWKMVEIPFDEFTPQSLRSQVNTSMLSRIGIVGAKDNFQADIAVSRIEFYQ